MIVLVLLLVRLVLAFFASRVPHAGKKTAFPFHDPSRVCLHDLYKDVSGKHKKRTHVMVTTRVELATLALLAPRSNQLS